MNLEGRNLVENPALIAVDKWIYSRLNTAARLMEEAFLSYRFNDAAQTVYEYFWNDFCDWYLEATKLSVKAGSGEAEKDRATTVLLDVLAESLKLLHPLLPFVTEEIYGKLPFPMETFPAETQLLITASYPVYEESRRDEKAERDFAFLQELVRQIRTLRSECTVSPEKKIRVLARVREKGDLSFLTENGPLVKLLAGIGEFAPELARAEESKPEGSIGIAGTGFEAFVFIAEAVDMKFLKQKFSKELERDLKFVESLRAKLGNANFLKNAPPELVAEEKLKLEEGLKKTAKLQSYIQDMA
jgi:valyl-tRNA synthetase